MTHPTTPPSTDSLRAPDAVMTALPSSLVSERPPPEGGPRPVLEATLAALVVPHDHTWRRHPSGMIASPMHTQAPIAFDPRAFVAHGDAARAATFGVLGFSRVERGRVMLAPRSSGEHLELLHTDGEALVVRDRHVVAWSGRTPQRREAPWPLELLEFAEDAVLVLGLTRPFVTFDVRAELFELRTDLLIGWAGDLTVQKDAAFGHTRLEGDGTVLFLPGV